MRKVLFLSLAILFAMQSWSQTATILYSEDFEGALSSPFTFSSSSSTNAWYTGGSFGNPGSSLYVSDDGGILNHYDPYSDTYATASVLIDFGSYSEYRLSFDWKAKGEADQTGYDFLRVYLVPANYTPPIDGFPSGAGTIAVSDYLVNPLPGAVQWEHESTVISGSYSGMQKLVFYWRNDASYYRQPPASVDNILIEGYACARPTNVNIPSTGITSTSANITWNSTSGATNYWFYWSVANLNIIDSVQVSGTSYALSGLSPSTLYDVWVRSECGSGNLSILTVTKTFRTTCGAITALPWSEFFDSYGINTGISAFPPCWKRNVTADNLYIENTYEDYYRSFPGSLHFKANTTVTSNIIAITPQFANSIEIGTLKVNGWYMASTALQVGVMTNPNDASTFTLVTALPQNSGPGSYNYQPFEVPLTPYPGTGKYVAFRLVGGASNSFGWLDDIVIDYVSGCPNVSNFDVVQETNYSAKVTWNNAVIIPPQTGWILAWQEAPASSFDPETAPNQVSLTAASYPYFLQNLTPGSTYSFAMRSDCQDGAWSATKTITIYQVVTVPYSENFQTTPNIAFNRISSSANAWRIGSATGNTGNSMYISNNNGTSNQYTTTAATHASASILVDFGNYAEWDLSFDWKAYGEEEYDFLRVYIVPADYTLPANLFPSGTGVTQLGSDMNLQTSWQHANLPIVGAYSGTIQKIVFYWRNDGGAGIQPPAAVDNISITGTVCGRPYNIAVNNITQTTANVTWNQGGGITSWRLYYTINGSGVVDSVNVSNTPAYTLLNLQPNTTYNVWLKANCGVDGLSGNSTPYSFKTPCVAITSMPYSDNFDGYGAGETVFPDCWTRNTTQANRPYVRDDNYHSAPASLYFWANTTAGGYNIAAIPEIASSIPVNTLVVKGWHFRASTASAIQIGVMDDPSNASTFVPLGTIQSTGAWAQFEVALTSYQGTGRYIAFRTNSNVDAGYSFLDDVVIDYNTSTCVAPTNLAVNSITAHTANITWTQGSNETKWTLAYKPTNESTWTEVSNLTSTAFTIANLTGSTCYDVQVRAICGSDLSPWTATYSFCTPVGIPSLTLTNGLQLYPNPTTGELQILNYELREGDKVEIYNLLGQKQSSTFNAQHSTIDVSHLPAGMYTLKIGGYAGKFVKK